MKRQLAIFCVIATGLLSACGSSDNNNNSSTSGAAGYNYAEYMPLVPDQLSSCTSIADIVFGDGAGGTVTTTIDGSMETIHYTSGDLTGLVVTRTDGTTVESLTLYNDGSIFKVLRFDDNIPSTDCNLSAHPDALSFGNISDGMIKNILNFANVSRMNPTQCSQIPNANEPGNKALYRIADVTVRGETYTNAIVEYWLDLDIPWVALQYQGDYGIPLPSSSETQGNSITDIAILASGQGEVAHLGVDAATGAINQVSERYVIACQ